jgi:hypothetical protein
MVNWADANANAIPLPPFPGRFGESLSKSKGMLEVSKNGWVSFFFIFQVSVASCE